MTKRKTKSQGVKRRTRSRNRNNKRASAPIWARLISFLLVTSFFTFVFYQADGLVFQTLYQCIAHKPTEGDFAAKQLRNAINDFHSIGENKRNRERLLKNLSDPVVWYNKSYSHASFPSHSLYDQFEFLNPLQYDGTSDRRGNNYEIRFDGAYRFRHPDTALLKFESGTAIIRNGYITSLTTAVKPNAYTAKWINSVYRYYFWTCFLSSGVLTLLLFVLSQTPTKFTDLVVRIGRWIISGMPI